MSKRQRRGTLAATLAGVVLVVASCSTGSTGGIAGSQKATTTTLPPPKVTATVENGATDVPVSDSVGLTVTEGTFTKVTMERGPGATFAPEPGDGVFNDTHTGWLGPGDLAPNTPYQIVAAVNGANGEKSTKSWNFTTGGAPTEIHTTLNVGDGDTYGVGMPIIVKLNTPAPAVTHKAVTDRLQVTSTPAVPGAWRWVSDSELHYRTKDYWPAHAKVSLKIDFAGLHLGKGIWGVDGRTVNFSIGDSHISLVDAAAHTMSVKVNGQQVKNFPVSTGSAKYPTHSGIHVVNEKSPKVVMDSATVGIPRNSPDGYYETVLWDVRISNSGEFVHSAPWSEGAQGNSNVSHGCVNASPADAEWFYNFSMPGDVVQVINTPLALQPWNGYGDWQIPWDQWAN